jgi:hypothetical protein
MEPFIMGAIVVAALVAVIGVRLLIERWLGPEPWPWPRLRKPGEPALRRELGRRRARDLHQDPWRT